jgi:hypothetical protein
VEPDLLIRTSGEVRVSNFLLWQISYAEFYFTQTLWPDFSEADLILAFENYRQRQRRFGGLSDEGDSTMTSELSSLFPLRQWLRSPSVTNKEEPSFPVNPLN